MKNHGMFFFLVLISLLFCPGKHVMGQRFVGGLKGGLAASEVSGDNLSSPNKLGWFGAVFTNIRVGDFSRVQLELMYIQKGSRSTPNEKNNFYDYRFTLQYAEIPFLLVVDFPWGDAGGFADRISLEGGLSAAFLVGSNEVENDRVLDLSGEKPYHNQELNLLMGLYYPITGQVHFHLRFSQGITPLRPHEGGTAMWYNRGQYNTVWTFGLVWELL
ncbi:MAG: outer membrane beta-barrel protein [Bacteroidales bacterium]|jgi:hypothetical protein|nr:outer membrane beta-barrel protein [Bacteroidales bacterium]NLM92839.1 PorT family protein [Bacteroidales bacterium]